MAQIDDWSDAVTPRGRADGGQTRADHCGSTDPCSAGNCSLMRLAPVAIRYWKGRPTVRDAAARQSITTHAASEAEDACILCAEMLADAIVGRPRFKGVGVSSKLGGRRGGGGYGLVAQQAAHGHQRLRLRGVLSIGRSPRYDRAVRHAANLGQDTHTTAAIAGQLAEA